MCGIAGVVSPSADRAERSLLVQAMCGLIEHRGPDDEGFYTGDAVTLGMRRLSIIDVKGGHQPVTNEDRTVWVVFNGEIYNFRELRAQLKAAGHVFTTYSDTETIVHAYETYGDDFPTRLDGMFAIAVWDDIQHRLVLARDRFGKKPLFYARLPSGLVFASELKCLLLHPEFDRAIDPVALDRYLAYGYVPAPQSIFGVARKLLPAQILSYDARDGRMAERPYWHLEPRRADGPLSARDRDAATVELESRLEEAVRARLVSDVPLGAFLSGGLDSSVVVALMSRLTRERVKTFTIAFDDRSYNEAPAARRTAHMLGTDHRELLVRPDFEHLLTRIIWGMDEPQADSSLVPTYYVSELARHFVTVCLTGDGGDEAFVGYPRYFQAVSERRFDRIPPALRLLAGAVGDRFPPGMRGKQGLSRIPLHWTGRYASAMTIFHAELRSSLYSPDWRATVGDRPANEYLDALFRAQPQLDVVSALQWVDVHSYLTDDILAKVDRMSMINSLETRAPLLDHRLVEFAFSLPSDAFFRHGMGKLLFRDVARRLVPAELLNRPKMGFGIPLSEWLRGGLRPLVDDALVGSGLERRGWLQSRPIARLVREHQSGVLDHSQRLWSVMCLELWARQFLDVSPQTLRAPRHSATFDVA